MTTGDIVKLMGALERLRKVRLRGSFDASCAVLACEYGMACVFDARVCVAYVHGHASNCPQTAHPFRAAVLLRLWTSPHIPH